MAAEEYAGFPRMRSGPDACRRQRSQANSNALNPTTAVMNAEALSRKLGIVGADRLRSEILRLADFGDAKFIRKFGDVSDDLSAL